MRADRVRRVAPKLIANGESHALRSREAAQLGYSSGPQDWAVTWQ